MIWIPFAIMAAASLAKVISDIVAEESSDPEVHRNARIASDVSSVVAEISSIAVRFVPKVPPSRFPKA